MWCWCYILRWLQILYELADNSFFILFFFLSFFLWGLAVSLCGMSLIFFELLPFFVLFLFLCRLWWFLIGAEFWCALCHDVSSKNMEENVVLILMATPDDVENTWCVADARAARYGLYEWWFLGSVESHIPGCLPFMFLAVWLSGYLPCLPFNPFKLTMGWPFMKSAATDRSVKSTLARVHSTTTAGSDGR